MPPQNPTPWRASARRGSLSVVLWAFGLATTLLLVGLWGRAVTHDQPTVQATVRSVISAEIAGERIYSWLEDGVMSSTDVDPETAEQVMTDLREHPEIEAAIDSLVDQFVSALLTVEGGAATLELTDTLAPVVPLVASGLADHDISVDEAALAAALAEAETIDLDTGDAAAAVRVVESARSLLSLIVVLSALVLVLTGSSAIWLSEQRLAMVRTLATRIVLSSLSFAVLFRLGSWVLDPERGGSPIAGGGSILLASNAGVFITIALGAAAISGGASWLVRRRRHLAGQTVGESNSNTDTRELVSI